jgi:putrescine aminotransferase
MAPKSVTLCGLLEFIGFDRRFVRASGTRVTDERGTEYLDFLCGYGVFNLGHNHPEVIGAVTQVTGMVNMLQASLGVLSAPLASALAAVAPGALNRAFFANSGTEAVEGALKLARIATGRRKFLYADNSFHGKSFGSLSVTGRRKYQDPFDRCFPVVTAYLSTTRTRWAGRSIPGSTRHSSWSPSRERAVSWFRTTAT